MTLSLSWQDVVLSVRRLAEVPVRVRAVRTVAGFGLAAGLAGVLALFFIFAAAGLIEFFGTRFSALVGILLIAGLGVTSRAFQGVANRVSCPESWRPLFPGAYLRVSLEHAIEAKDWHHAHALLSGSPPRARGTLPTDQVHTLLAASHAGLREETLRSVLPQVRSVSDLSRPRDAASPPGA